MKVQFIRTPRGEEMAVIPRTELEALLQLKEDVEDIREAEAIMTGVRNRTVETFPLELIKSLSKGENPIRVWREYRALTADQLAKAAGLSRTYITQIETGRRKGTVDVLKSIAKALSIGLDDIVNWAHQK